MSFWKNLGAGTPRASERFELLSVGSPDFRPVLDKLFWQVMRKGIFNCFNALLCEVLPVEWGAPVYFVRLPSDRRNVPELFLSVADVDEARPILAMINSFFDEVEGAPAGTSSRAFTVLRWLSEGTPDLIAGNVHDDGVFFAVGFFANGAGKPYRDFLSEEKWRMLAEKAGVMLN